MGTFLWDEKELQLGRNGWVGGGGEMIDGAKDLEAMGGDGIQDIGTEIGLG